MKVPQLQAAVAPGRHQDVLVGLAPRHVKQAVAPLPAAARQPSINLGDLDNTCFVYVAALPSDEARSGWRVVEDQQRAAA